MASAAACFNWIGALGAGVQSAFAWTTFNQQAFIGNVSMRQNQSYQKKNYKISWISMARDDIRSLLTISVNRINNYIIVSALILGLTSAGVFAVSFDVNSPKFLEEMFLMSMGMSFVFLMVAIMLGVKGQNAAFTHTMKLLIHEMRPENPAEYNHNYMMQAQYIERDGLNSIFRIPGVMPKYGEASTHEQREVMRNQPATETSFHPGSQRKSAKIGAPSQAPAQFAALDGQGTPDGFENLEFVGQNQQEQLWYLIKFAHFMRLWMPFDVYCKFSMSLGMIALGHGTMYFVLCKIWVGHYFLTLLCMTSPFLYFPMVVVSDNFQFPSKRIATVGAILELAGPLFGLIAVYARYHERGTKSALVEAISVPLCFFAHSLFYMAVFTVAYSSFGDAKLPTLAQEEDVLSDMIAEFREALDGDIATEELESCKAGLEESSNTEQADTEGWESDAKYRPSIKSTRSKNSRQTVLLDNSATGFPTDSDLFEKQVEKLQRNVRRTLRHALLVSVTMYSLLTLRACRRMVERIHDVINTPSIPIAVVLSEWPVDWNAEPLFRPHAVACAGQTVFRPRASSCANVFLADRFHVYELHDMKRLQRIPGCNFEHDIADVTSGCVETNGTIDCFPVVLVPRSGNGYELRTCEGAKDVRDYTFADDLDGASLYSKLDSRTVSTKMLITAQNGELVQYERIGTRWQPQGTLGGVSATLKSVSANRDFMIEFHPHRIQKRSVTAFEHISSWKLPHTIGNLTSGSSMTGGSTSVILSYTGTPPDDLVPHIFQVSLPGLLDVDADAFEISERSARSEGYDANFTQLGNRTEHVKLEPHSLLSRRQHLKRSAGTLQLDIEPSATLHNFTGVRSDDRILVAAKRSKRCKRSCKPGWK